MNSLIWVRVALLAIVSLLAGLLLTQFGMACPGTGFGECSRCSCPSFFGFGYTCDRAGCGHHYDSHW